VGSKKRAPKGPTLQERLLWEKEKAGSYAKLAARTGCSTSQLHDWATGKYEPGLANLRRIADAFECAPADLVRVAS
jgi:transcriptional regulator with XRE-family HTH domain